MIIPNLNLSSMELQIILSIATIVLLTILLVLVIVLLFIGNKKTDLSEITALLKRTTDDQRDAVVKQIENGATTQFERFGLIQNTIQETLLKNSQSLVETLKNNRIETSDRLDKFVKLISDIGEQTQNTLQANREKMDEKLMNFGEKLEIQLSSMRSSNIDNNEKLKETLALQMKSLQESNEKRLEQIQGVVDKKLQETLETQFTQKFKLVGEQLDSVQQGLGEMKTLAADAKSLKNALTNVKDRGTYGEVRLEKLLADILDKSQYDTNVEISNNKRVEFAIKLPGKGDTPLLLPIDSKFPMEDYNRILDAEDKNATDEARKSLALKIRSFAKDIHDKYIVSDKTTDFALLFLPTEGLFAEVVQNVTLVEELRDKYKVTVVGMTTLSAFLSSLLMGFKTLAIEQRSQEVWQTLQAVKREYVKFGDLLDTAHKQIRTVDKTFEDIRGVRTRQLDKAFKKVETLSEHAETLMLDATEVEGDE